MCDIGIQYVLAPAAAYVLYKKKKKQWVAKYELLYKNNGNGILTGE